MKLDWVRYMDHPVIRYMYSIGNILVLISLRMDSVFVLSYRAWFVTLFGQNTHACRSCGDIHCGRLEYSQKSHLLSLDIWGTIMELHNRCHPYCVVRPAIDLKEMTSSKWFAFLNKYVWRCLARKADMVHSGLGDQDICDSNRPIHVVAMAPLNISKCKHLWTDSSVLWQPAYIGI
jgi:hypothetical protein